MDDPQIDFGFWILDFGFPRADESVEGACGPIVAETNISNGEPTIEDHQPRPRAWAAAPGQHRSGRFDGEIHHEARFACKDDGSRDNVPMSKDTALGYPA